MNASTHVSIYRRVMKSADARQHYELADW